MTPQQIILVKHSLPEIEPDTPAAHWHLSDEGRQRSIRLADQLRVHLPFVVVSSSEVKAVETARAVTQYLHLPDARTGENLHEHERYNERFTNKELFESKVRQFFAEPTELVFGLETAETAYERFMMAVRRLLAEQCDSTLVVVAHGTVISLLVSRHNPVEPFAFWKQLELPSFVVLSTPDFKVISVVPRIA